MREDSNVRKGDESDELSRDASLLKISELDKLNSSYSEKSNILEESEEDRLGEIC